MSLDLNAAEAERPWIALYEDGVADAPMFERQDMLSVFEDAVRRAGDRVALRYLGATYTFGELDGKSDALAAALRDNGLLAGDRIAIILQNVPQFAILTLAAWKLNAVPVPTNPMYQSEELAKILGDAAPKAVLCDVRQAATVSAALSIVSLEAMLISTDSAVGQSMLSSEVFGSCSAAAVAAVDLAQILHQYEGRHPPRTRIAGSDLGLLMYTSGTTGVPKGAMISHGSLAFSARLTSVWMQHKPDSIILAIAPLFHITGFAAQFASAIDAACTVLLTFRMLTDVVLDVIRSYRPTHTIGAITAFNALMNTSGATPADFASFKRVYSGGAPVPPSLREQIKELMGLTIYPGFGMTETTALAHLAPLGIDVPVDEASGALAIGVPVPNTDAIVVDDEGRPLPCGKAGELLLRGPQLMRGYWNMPEESAKALAEGWMHSGDIAVMDSQGWFYIVDRKKDMIIASGFKVWPREVEDCLYRHEAVREAAVIGVADAYRGETVKAFVSLRPGIAATAQDLTAHCRDRLAAYKRPRLIEILPELPKTVSGKIQRNLLRDL
jgi:long-chain acyl-CoA synthetase